MKNKILVAVSGGVDSMVLLDKLWHEGYEIECIHINHLTRGYENQLDYEVVQSYCKNKKIKLHYFEYNHQEGNFQSKAREFRYNKFKEVVELRNLDFVALAHHADDNVENVLMNPKKIKSRLIDKKTKWDGITVYRPLIESFKDEIYEYAKTNKVSFREDPSNKENKYLRNKYRNGIISLLNKEEKKEIIDNEKRRIEKIKKELDLEFLEMSYETKQYYIYSLIKEKTDENISLNLIEGIINGYTINGSKQFKLPKNNILYLEYGNFFIRKSKKIANEIHFLPKKGYNNISGIKFFNPYDQPVKIRNRKPGDKIVYNGISKKLNRLFIEKKIPVYKRDEILLIVNENDEVLSIVEELNE